MNVSLSEYQAGCLLLSPVGMQNQLMYLCPLVTAYVRIPKTKLGTTAIDY